MISPRIPARTEHTVGRGPGDIKFRRLAYCPRPTGASRAGIALRVVHFLFQKSPASGSFEIFFSSNRFLFTFKYLIVNKLKRHIIFDGLGQTRIVLLKSFLQILAMALVKISMLNAFQNMRIKHKGVAVISPRIELGYQVPETCVLSFVLRDQ